MKEVIYTFSEGDFVYCSKIQGIHKILRIFKQEDNKPPMLVLEHLYDNKYNKIIDKPRDREYTVDGSYCKNIDFKKLLLFEQKKFEHIRKVITGLQNEKR